MGIYPDYADSVAFYAVGVDPSEDLELKESYRQQEGHPWPVADPVGSMLRDLKIWGWLPRAFSFSCLVGKAHHVESFAEMGIVAA